MKLLLEEVRDLPAGDYCECGVYQGDSARFIAGMMAPGTVLFLFDSFRGHPAPGEFDMPEHHPEGRYSDTTSDLVRKKVPDAILIGGFFPRGFDLVAHRTFRFVNVDCDLYESTKLVIDFFKHRMVPGGIMRFDDYGAYDCPGAKKAVDERFTEVLHEGTEFYVRKP